VDEFLLNFTASNGRASIQGTPLYASCSASACRHFQFEQLLRAPVVSSSQIAFMGLELCMPQYGYLCPKPDAAVSVSPPTTAPANPLPHAQPIGNYTEVNVTLMFPGNFNSFFSNPDGARRKEACDGLCSALQTKLLVTMINCQCLEGSLVVVYRTAVRLDDTATLNFLVSNADRITSAGDYAKLVEGYAAVAQMGGPPTMPTPVVATDYGTALGFGFPVPSESACDAVCGATVGATIACSLVALLWVVLLVARCGYGPLPEVIPSQRSAGIPASVKDDRMVLPPNHIRRREQSSRILFSNDRSRPSPTREIDARSVIRRTWY
jgi:hypothetical protein